MREGLVVTEVEEEGNLGEVQLVGKGARGQGGG